MVREMQVSQSALSVLAYLKYSVGRLGRRPLVRGSGMRAVMALVLGAACTAAVAGPPFLTDDPGTVDLHHAEVNLISQQTRADGGRAGSASGEVNVGCATETQCHVAAPVAFNRQDAGSLQAGLGDVELGIKYRFLNRPEDGWSAAVYPTFFLPTGNAARGLGNGRAQLLLPLWVQRTSGKWSWDAGLARLVNRATGARNSWFAGLLGRRSFGDRLSLGAELFRRTSTAVGIPSASGFNVGAIVQVSERQNLLISAGRGLTHVETNRSSLFIAYQLEL
jgi:hypothetical protein